MEMSSPSQGDFFGAPRNGAVRPVEFEPATVALAERMPRTLRLGTSSWTTPGWQGLVYAEHHEPALLARAGLEAYTRHPLLRAVGVDSTFYAPAPPARLERDAAAVPNDFRFLVKAWSALTTPPSAPRPAHLATVPDLFLDPACAVTKVVEPAARALGGKLGTLLFQFSPLGRDWTARPAEFVARLERFLGALPHGPRYAVELRDPEFLGAEYESALRAANAVHCANVHPRMPPVDIQTSGAERRGDERAPLVIRWMLQPGHTYESAARRYAPYDRLVDPDSRNRERVAAMACAATAAGREVIVIANNKAEGCAPLTLTELARSIDRRRLRAW
jgi:uncharacterized protein YecE (DUF72 family)